MFCFSFIFFLAPVSCPRMISDAYSLCGVWGPWNNFFPIERLFDADRMGNFQDSSWGAQLKACLHSYVHAGEAREKLPGRNCVI
uniref:Secreted protein n=1 Tax=Setaria viridis TaxID=4556 RepID=A0A4U6WE18_SETVI|nr:hypothetical protein SEVIR_1G217850v2 [Setaria viridis]